MKCVRLIPPLAALWAALLFGCGPVDSVCDDDRYGCDGNVSGWTIDTQCELTGDLTVVPGHGDTAFQALQSGQLPELHSGSQGGQHLFAALQIDGVATDQHQRLKVNIEARQAPVDGATTGALMGSRSLILPVGAGNIAGAKRVVDYGLVVFLQPGTLHSLKFVVTDPCGRTGSATTANP